MQMFVGCANFVSYKLGRWNVSDLLMQIYQCGEKKAEHQSGEINERNPLGENSLIKPSGTEEEKTPGFPTQNAVILHFIVWLKMINKKKKRKKILAITN